MTRIAVVGMGAVGTVVASKLARTPGMDVRAVASGERLAGLKADPPTLNGGAPVLPPEAFRAEPPDEWDGAGAELAVVAVKTGALEGAARDLAPWLARGGATAVLPLLNGIRATGILEAALGKGAATVLRGLVLCNSAVRAGHAVTQSGTFRVRLGGPEAAAERAEGILAAAGIDADRPADIEAAQFEKWLLNVGLNQAEALLGLAHGKLLANPDATAFMWALVGEGVAVGRALDVAGVEEMPGRIGKALKMLTPEGKSSMLQDVEAGRGTEVGAFAGELCRLAAETGVPAPCNELVLRALPG